MNAPQKDLSRMNRQECRTCHSKNLELYLPLGDQALANSFLTQAQLQQAEEKYPLEVFYCADCFHSQLGYAVDPEVMFRDYLWVSGTSDEIPVHFAKYAEEVYEKFMKPGDLVVEVASNDGTLLKVFKQFDCRLLGIEPARNIAEIAEAQGVPTLAEFFNVETLKGVVAEHGQAKAIISNNVFAHVDDMDGFTQAAVDLLAEDGTWTIESPHALQFIQKNEFDTVYHEHISYLSLYALIPFFQRHGLNLYDVQQTPVHGGSIRMYLSKDMSLDPTARLKDLYEKEIAAGINAPETYTQFYERVETMKTKTLELLRQLKSEGKTIVGYGASAKGQTLLQYYGIDTELLDYVADKAPLKQGRYTPGTHIPVVPAEKILETQPDYVFILAWNFGEEIIRQQAEYAQKGGKFILPIPEPKIV